MGRKIGLVHALSPNVRLFKELTAKIMPDVEAVHLVDEGLPSLSDPKYHKDIVRRLGLLASLAEESGAEIILLTCTAFGRLADEVATAVNIPILAVLEIVADEATNLSDHIGILATHPGTMSSAAQIIQDQTARRGGKVEVKTSLCEGAFEALKSEDWASHDRIVTRCLKELMEDVKVVVIPQPSMERVVKQLPESDRKVPVLSSAELSVHHLKEKLDELPPKRQ